VTQARFAGDDWRCQCGNQPHTDGFYPRLKTGKIVDATGEEWRDGDLYRCARCDAIIEFDAIANRGEIVGKTDKTFIAPSQL
jgi:hypothetical protein